MSRRLGLLFAAPLYLFAVALPLSQGVSALLMALLVAITLLRWALPNRPRFTIPRSIWIPLLVFLGVQVLATVFSSPYPIKWGKLASETWLKSLLLLVPLLAAGQAQHARRAVQLTVLVGAVVGVYGIYQHFTGVDFWRGGHTPTAGARFMAVGFFGHHLSYGGHVLVLWIAAGAWALLGTARGRIVRSLPWIAWIILSLALVWSYARSAQLGAIAAALVLAWSLPGRRRWAALAALAALGAMALATPSVASRFAELADPSSETTRLNLWRSSLAAIQAHPLLGCGLGNFGEMMAVHGVEGFYDTQAHSHNDFLMHAVNAGLLGLGAALTLLVASSVVLWRGRRGRGEMSWLLVAGVACQIGISVGGLFQVYQTDNEVEMALYFLLGCAVAALRPQNSPSSSG